MNGEHEPCLSMLLHQYSKVGCIQEDIFLDHSPAHSREFSSCRRFSFRAKAKQQQKIALGGGALNRETKFMHSRNNPEIMPFELLPISLASHSYVPTFVFCR